MATYKPHHALELSQRVQPAAQDTIAEASRHLRDYVALSGSTTAFLETRARARIGVEVISQRVVRNATLGELLIRHSRLYVGIPENAILIADAEVLLERLDADQRSLALAGTEGLGRLLDPDERDLLRKRDVELECIAAPLALGVSSPFALARSFDLLLSGVVCARMREVVCDESLARLG